MPTTTPPPSPTFALIVLQGDYDIERQQELRSQLAPATSLELALLDVRDVTFLDATALAELIKLKERMVGPAVVRIIGASPRIRKTLASTGLNTLFEMHNSFGSAVVP